MINKIEIGGYKSIKSVKLELKPINIFIGSNGVGKSNLISLFKLIQVLFEKRLENYSIQQGADNLLHFGKKNTKQITCYIEFDEINAYSFALQPTRNDKLFVANEFVLFNKSKMGYGTGWSETLLTLNQSEATIKSENFAVANYVRTYIQSFRVYHFHDTSDNAPLRADSTIDDNRYLKENGSNLASFLYYLQEKHPKSFARIEKTIQSIIPSFDAFKLAPQRLNENIMKLEWSEKNHPEQYFNASHLSDGSLRFIALTTLLMQPELPKTIIIDEPELGLHPVAINKLAGMLKSAADKKCQIIISTQSVNLVNNFSANDIVTVDRDSQESNFNRLDTEKLTEWLDDYSIGELWTKSVIKGQP